MPLRPPPSTQPHRKFFLVLMLGWDVACKVRGGLDKVNLLVYEAEQVSGLRDGKKLDMGQVVEGTGAIMSSLLAREYLVLSSLALLVVDNLQVSARTKETTGFMEQNKRLARNHIPRLVIIMPNALASNTDSSLTYLPRQLAALQSLVPTGVEGSCKNATQLRLEGGIRAPLSHLEV